MADDNEGKPTFSADDLAELAGEAGAGAGADGAAAEAEGKVAATGADGKGAEGTGEEPADGKAGGDGKTAEGAEEAGKDGKAAGKDKVEDGKAKKADDYLPADWREKEVARLGLTGDALKKAQEIAKRASTPAELLRSVIAGADKVREATEAAKGRIKIPTGKDDKPEDVAAFRKAMGVPEKAEQYSVPNPPEELGERSDLDKELIGEALQDFHKVDLNQKQVTAVINTFDRVQQIIKRQVQERAAKADDDADEALRTQHLRDYKPNLELAERFLESEFAQFYPEKADRVALLNMRLEDGTRLGNYPPLVNFFIHAAKNGTSAVADDGAPPRGADGDLVDIDKRIAEITALAHSSKPADETKYKSLQGELERLVTAKVRRDQKAAAKA
jgi:hypothetical protein